MMFGIFSFDVKYHYSLVVIFRILFSTMLYFINTEIFFLKKNDLERFINDAHLSKQILFFNS
jgi:hypothetical protein